MTTRFMCWRVVNYTTLGYGVASENVEAADVALVRFLNREGGAAQRRSNGRPVGRGEVGTGGVRWDASDGSDDLASMLTDYVMASEIGETGPTTHRVFFLRGGQPDAEEVPARVRPQRGQSLRHVLQVEEGGGARRLRAGGAGARGALAGQGLHGRRRQDRPPHPRRLHGQALLRQPRHGLVQKIPRGQEKFLSIIDLKGWGYSSCDMRAYIAAIEIMQNYYPERLGKALMIHVPSIFMKAWKMIYPFIDNNTRDKFVFVDDKSLQETLHREIDESQLPEFLGGNIPLIPLKDYVQQSQSV
ncbi:uncharacterized protein LOC133908312 [Phragmites australis]|uniref:uncharacterized protein LOC133908312 n=1 Tax=Phragmites australis TaxID=29695 RepID=UPI002D799A73|nr:uncharacterized protein LOC133908312 [Phragmites australis]